ncbi:MAG TPA: type II toxin-antitoxin system VapC family toxin [Candidatus Binataceae bacterium]|nr:type II toxin-antitoxin system VapC family toxin [Candidatus Binataceae bacterium]
MTGVDTNVLLRYLVQDDPEQARKATRFIAHECSADAPALINRIVMCELVWVLESAYGYSREKVIFALEKILRTTQFRIEDAQEAWLSLREYQAGADFADAFIASINRRLGCEHTVTLDRKASRRQGFVAL